MPRPKPASPPTRIEVRLPEDLLIRVKDRLDSEPESRGWIGYSNLVRELLLQWLGRSKIPAAAYATIIGQTKIWIVTRPGQKVCPNFLSAQAAEDYIATLGKPDAQTDAS